MFRSHPRLSKLYELRIYTMKPDMFPKYCELTNQWLHLRTAHSRLCGFWLTEIGGQNEAVHIWEYDNLAHRKRVRDALGLDKQWQQQYMAEVRSCWQSQNNWLLVPSPGGPTASGQRSEAPFYRLSVGSAPQASPPPNSRFTCVGSFTTAVGDGTNKIVTLDASSDIDALVPPTVADTNIPPALSTTRIMLRSAWSAKLDCLWQ